MNNVYCRAPWVSVSYMPGGKYAPCCQWRDKMFDSVEEMHQTLSKDFLANNIPETCKQTCPATSRGWRFQFEQYPTDYSTHQVHFLDFRNSNLCNLKCRTCGPGFSTSWASEIKGQEIYLHEIIDVDEIDLSNVKTVYFAGGEPLLNVQHYELLEKLIAAKVNPMLRYSTNLTIKSIKDYDLEKLWSHFTWIQINASVDAVGDVAGSIRSSSFWTDVERNIQWLRTMSQVYISIATVISALNIWFLPQLFDYFNWIDAPNNFEPILVDSNSAFGLSIIPVRYRSNLINMLNKLPVNEHPNVKLAIDVLQQDNYNSERWNKFISQQLVLDSVRNESWFKHFPYNKDVYRDLVYGQT